MPAVLDGSAQLAAAQADSFAERGNQVNWRNAAGAAQCIGIALIPVRIEAKETGKKTIKKTIKEGRFANRPYEVGKMANRKQLAILKQGVATWNKWREENPNAKIDLRGAKLEGLNLSRANFRKADVRGVNFRHAELIGADFTEALFGSAVLQSAKQDLIFFKREAFSIFAIFLVNLISTYIGKKYMIDVACISEFLSICIIVICIIIISYHIVVFEDRFVISSSFQGACIENAIFDKSTFAKSFKNKKINFSEAKLNYTSWMNVHGFENAYFNKTILTDKDVYRLLISANGHEISLYGKNLKGAYLVKFDLRGVDLRETNLLLADLRCADITGAKFYGSARENWIIDGIRCDYVYWDEAGEVRTPPDRDFRPGEFEELYKQLPSFEYIFANGVTPLDMLIMDRVVQAINEQHKEFSLELVSFDKRGEPHATLTVCHSDYVDTAKKNVTELYEKTIEHLMLENEEKKQRIKSLYNIIDQLINRIPTIEDLKKMGDTYNNYGQTAAMGKNASASGNTFQQITAELSHLHEAMRNAAANPAEKAAADEVAKAEQAAKQQDEPKMRQHLKNAGKFAVDCVQKIGAEALSEYLKKVTLGM